MPRPYSNELRNSLNENNPDRLGVQLGKLCVKANLPALYIAKAFGVTRMSIHSWFRGQYVREKNFNKIENFIKIAEEDFRTGILPALTLNEAKDYIEKNIINKI